MAETPAPRVSVGASGTYVLSGSRAGHSVVLSETGTRTYAVANPSVVTESYVAPPAAGGQNAVTVICG